ncbi:alpha-1A adrenergic receptor-like [Dysidea avara]|uniref:alpha-1A adrenergic receptor-like n=1 Tax=Dysidea avara TaxID=196820 RepID=UPI00331EEB59
MNGSDIEEVDYPTLQLYVALPTRLLMSFVVIFLATIVLQTVEKSRRDQHTLHYFFINNLMISDITAVIVANVSAEVVIAHTIINEDTDGIECTSIMASKFPYLASFGILAALAFERMIVALYPIKYDRIVTKKRAYIVVGLVWLVSVFVALLVYADPKLDVKTKTAICKSSFYKYIFWAVASIFLIASVVFVLVQNIYIFRMSLDHIRGLQRCGTINNEDRTNNLRGEYRAALSLFWYTQKPSIAALLVVGSDVLFHLVLLPISSLIAEVCNNTAASIFIWSVLFNLLVYCGIASHSLLYALFLDSFHVVFGCQRCHLQLVSCLAPSNRAL